MISTLASLPTFEQMMQLLLAGRGPMLRMAKTRPLSLSVVIMIMRQ